MVQNFPPTLLLLEPYVGSKIHHQMQCLDCDHVWSATPLSKAQAWVKNGVNGCPECNTKRKKASCEEWQLIVDAMPHLQVDMDALCSMARLARNKISVKNIDCGHTFVVSVSNLLSQGVKCTVCNTARKSQVFRDRNIASTLPHEEVKLWRRYKAVANRLSTLNAPPMPPGTIRGKAGVQDAWQLDHIYPLRKAYNEGWSVVTVSSAENLQWLPWRDNLMKRDKLPE